jgi:hypothetical protein
MHILPLVLVYRHWHNLDKTRIVKTGRLRSEIPSMGVIAEFASERALFETPFKFESSGRFADITTPHVKSDMIRLNSAYNDVSSISTRFVESRLHKS